MKQRICNIPEDDIQVLEANYVHRLIMEEEAQSAPVQAAYEDIHLLSVYKARAFDGREKREAIILPDYVNDSMLEEDLERGAYPFRKLADISELDIPAQVVFFRASTLELGLKACVYMAGLQHVDSYCGCPSMFDLATYDPFDGTTVSGVIPIVPIAELLSGPSSYGVGLGDMSLSGISCSTPRIPYWDDHTGSMIIVNNNCSGFFMGGKDYLSNALDRVVNTKEHIYVVTVENIADDDDDEIPFGTTEYLKALVQYQASAFDIIAQDPSAYDNKILEGLCREIGLTIPNGYPRKELLGRLDRICPDMKAEFLRNLLLREYYKREARELSPELLTLLGRLESGNSQRLKGWALLDSLEGMDGTKTEIRGLVNAIKISKARRSKGFKSEAIVACLFTGAPGTAKTTAAQALADILFEEHLLASNRLYSCVGSALQGEYVGQTGGKVRGIVEDSDVVFIDEAYSLSEAKKSGSPYAAEALAELCALMTAAAEKGDKLFIFAGYGGSESTKDHNLMREFLESNPGIKSRVSCVVNFSSYSAPTMAEVFLKICSNDGFTFSAKDTKLLRTEVAAYFEERVSDPAFGNGREAANLVAEALKIHSQTLDGKPIDELTDQDLQTLTIEDVRKAIASLRKMELARSGKGSQRISLLG